MSVKRSGRLLVSLIRVEAVVEFFVILGHLQKQFVRLELLAIFLLQHFAHVDEFRCAHAIDIGNRMQQPQIDISGTRVLMFSVGSEIGGGYLAYQNWINSLSQHSDIEREFFVESPIPHPSAMFRRALFDELGGYHESAWPEDYDLWCRALLAGKKFGKPEYAQNDYLLRWRDHQGRLSRLD